jgi:hypothetical protein
MTSTEQIVHLSRIEFWIFFLLASTVALGAFYFAFRNIVLARLVADTPTARIEFAQQGYVELSGTAMAVDDIPIMAPLSGMACCWYSYKIEKKGNKNWRRVEQQRSSQPFLLKDDSGICRIDPEGAQITTRDRTIWYGSTPFPGAAKVKNNRSKAGTWRSILTRDIGLGGRYRYTEERIQIDATLYCIGIFKTLDELDHQVNRGKTTREILRTWKQDKPKLLARFDRDRNGQIDQDEWQQARLAASAEGDDEYRREQAGKAPHSLSDSGSSSHPYLISTLPEFDLIKRFKLKATASITAFFIFGGIGVLLFGTRFGG